MVGVVVKRGGTVTFLVWWNRYLAANRVRAVADLGTRMITFELPDGTHGMVDVVEARALSIALRESVYDALEPDGPFLSVERLTDG